MKGGDRLPGYGEVVAYSFEGHTLMGISAGVVDAESGHGKISVYIPENDNFETMEFHTQVYRPSPYQRLRFSKQLRSLSLSNHFTEKFPGVTFGGKTRKRKNKNKKTRRR